MENCSPIDHFFDLDLALTMPNYNSSGSSQSLGLKASSDSESASPDQKKSSPAPEMDTVSYPVGVCTVCMEGFGSGTIGKRVPCGHVYHAACIATWLSLHGSCPLCRSKFDNISVDRQS